jgi:prevent-host-death family protein
MAERGWSVRDAKNRFSEVVKAARRRPQTVIRHGKPIVVVISSVSEQAEPNEICLLPRLLGARHVCRAQ